MHLSVVYICSLLQTRCTEADEENSDVGYCRDDDEKTEWLERILFI